MISRHVFLTLLLLAGPALAGQWPHYADGTVYCFDKEYTHRTPNRMPVAEANERCDHAVTLGEGFVGSKSGMPPIDGWYDPDTGRVTQQAPW
jgi:hypothetical protein